ncbi:MAG: tetratricopeptide repeat protein [Bacteroidetes bacterium]|nr:tetratricopeptide repeat protein [Bacteroidota bacterium]
MAKKDKKNSSNKEVKINPWVVFTGFLAISIIVFKPCFSALLTNWDDGSYVTDNLLIRSLSLKDIFSAFVVGNYHPITMLSYALEYHFFKINPTVFHTTNVLLHAVNSFLVFILVQKITKQNFIALFTSVLFCIHPFHVEPVAWVADRKDLLATLFFLLGIRAYLQYIASSTNKHYFFVIMFFLLSVLSKATSVVFPIVLILLDYLLMEKIELKKWLNKLPLLAISIAFGFLAIKAQSDTPAMGVRVDYNFLDRFFLGCYSFALYIINAVFPIKLSAYHPYPVMQAGRFSFLVYLSVIPVIAVVGLLIYYLKQRHKLPFVLLTFFLVTIGLLLQFIPVGFAIIAERYTYLPFIGLFALIAFYWHRFAKQKKYFWIAPIMYSLVLAFISFDRCKVWQNSLTLWTDVIEKYDKAELAYLNRGIIYAGSGQIQKGYDDFNKAIESYPDYLQAYNNRGLAKYDLGNVQGSIEDFNKAIQIDSTFYESLNNRGLSFLTLKQHDKAFSDFNAAIKFKPDFALAYYNRGNAFAELGEIEKAKVDIQQAANLYKQQNNLQLANRVLNRFKEL